MIGIRIIALLLLSIVFLETNAQISYGGHPKSFSKEFKKNIGQTVPPVKIEHLPVFNQEQFIKENSSSHSKKKGNLIGKAIETYIDIQENGEWIELEEGKLWRVAIESPGAGSLSIFFSRYKLTKGCELYIYPPSQSYFLGAYTEQNNKKSGVLPVQSIKGEQAIVELWVPNTSKLPQLTIGKVSHEFAIKKTGLGASGNCNIDINCKEGYDWQIEKRAVIKYSYIDDEGGTYSCSGALLNNTSKDRRPYIYTANHCVNSTTEAKSVVCYFGFEAIVCGDGKGNEKNTISGATFRATGFNSQLDFSLFELSEIPLEEYEPYYAGWDRSVDPTTSAVSIHHPQGDSKKIALDHDPIVTAPTKPNNWPDNEKSHWNVVWNEGVTEPGSSGAPLFGPNHLVIGDLSGGDAKCSNPTGKEYFTKFDLCWDYFKKPENSLKSWLDPLNTGQTTLNGYEPYDKKLSIDEIVFPNGPISQKTETIEPEIVLVNKSATTIRGYTIEVLIDDTRQYIQNLSEEITPSTPQLIRLPEIQAPDKGKLIIRLLSDISEEQYDEESVYIRKINGTPINLVFPNILRTSKIGWTITNEQTDELVYLRGSHHLYMNEIYSLILAEGCYNITLNKKEAQNNQEVKLVNVTNDHETILGSLKYSENNLDVRTCIGSPTRRLLKKKKTLEGAQDGIYEIQFMPGEELNIDLIDITGRVVEEFGIQNPEDLFALDLRPFNHGVYILRMSRNGITDFEKFVHYK